MPKNKLTASGKVALGCLALGAVVAGGAGYLAPAMVWWAYPAITLLVAAIAYPHGYRSRPTSVSWIERRNS